MTLLNCMIPHSFQMEEMTMLYGDIANTKTEAMNTISIHLGK